jgi:hypothetical protein
MLTSRSISRTCLTLWVAVAASTCTSGSHPSAPGRSAPVAGSFGPIEQTAIAFHADPDGRDDTYVMSAAGRDLRDRDGRAGDGRPAVLVAGWTASRRRLLCLRATIAFESIGDRSLYLVDVRGPVPGEARPFGVSGADPSWSPDGKRIAYFAEDDGNLDIYTMSAHVRRLTGDPGPDYSPVWSPDGSWLAFTRRTDHAEVWVMRSDGSAKRRLRGTRGGANDCCPAWRPG